MNKNTVKVESTFRVGYTQYLYEKGRLSESLEHLSIAGVSRELLVEFYRWIFLPSLLIVKPLRYNVPVVLVLMPLA